MLFKSVAQPVKLCFRLEFRFYCHAPTQRKVPIDAAELYKRLLDQRIVSPDNSKLLKVAVLGAPNSGKSSLINSLCRWRVCAVSQKVHTTRSKANVVLTDSEKQLVFVDTPGVVRPEAKKKHHLETSLIRDPHVACLDDDVKLVCVLQDLSNQFYRFRIDEQVLRLLYLLHAENEMHNTDSELGKRSRKRFILVLNKVDLVKKRGVVLDAMRRLTYGRLLKQSDSGRDKKLDQSAHKQVHDQFVQPKFKSFDSKEANASDPDLVDELMLDTSLSKMTVEERRAAYQRAARRARNESGFEHFSDIFIVSCNTQEGVGELRDYLLDNCEPRQWMYPADAVTDTMPRELVESVVWSKFLDAIDKDVPYSIQIRAEIIRPDNGGGNETTTASESVPFSPLHQMNAPFNASSRVTILCNAYCKDERSLKFALGKDGDMVRSIARAAKQELMNLFRCDVSLKLAIVLRKSERQKKVERKVLGALQEQAQNARLEQELQNRSTVVREASGD